MTTVARDSTSHLSKKSSNQCSGSWQASKFVGLYIDGAGSSACGRFAALVCPSELGQSGDHEASKGMDYMDYLAVFRAKIGRLRVEIADIQELNQQFRRDRRHGAVVQIAHGQRGERLQEIQHELGQLADLGRKAISTEQLKDSHRSPTHLVKRKRAA
jgi:hypothetical protein